MRKLIFGAVLLFTFISFCVNAQTAQIDDVRRIEFRGISPIFNESTNSVSGYYTFYVNEKVAGGMRNFVFTLFDLDLKEVKSTKITITKNARMNSSSFNGQAFLFVFNDMSKKLLYYYTLDRKGNIIKSVEENTEKRMLTTSDVYSANDGFFLIRPVKEKRHGYEIEKVDINLNSMWTQRFVPENGFIGVESIVSSGDRIFVIQQVAPTVMTPKSSKGELLCLASSNGEQIFKYPLFNGKETAQPSSFMIDNAGNIVTGGMYFEGERWDNVNSDGIFFLALNDKGEKVSYSTMSWDSGLQLALKETDGGPRIGSKPKVIFHQIAQASDGSYQVIGETFQKNLSLMPRAIADVRSLITGLWIGDMTQEGMITTLEIMDFIIFNFDSSGKIVNLYNIPKENTTVYLYPPYTNIGGLYLANVLRDFGMFNYGFTINRVAGGEEQSLLVSRNITKKDRTIRIQNLDPKKRSQSFEIPIEKQWARGYLGVAPNGPDKICIFFYDNKTKQVNLKLQSFEL